jgi:hypothetical protein
MFPPLNGLTERTVSVSIVAAPARIMAASFAIVT